MSTVQEPPNISHLMPRTWNHLERSENHATSEISKQTWISTRCQKSQQSSTAAVDPGQLYHKGKTQERNQHLLRGASHLDGPSTGIEDHGLVFDSREERGHEDEGETEVQVRAAPDNQLPPTTRSPESCQKHQQQKDPEW